MHIINIMHTQSDERPIEDLLFENRSQLAAFASMYCRGSMFLTPKQYLDALLCESRAVEIAAGTLDGAGHQLDPLLIEQYKSRVKNLQPHYHLRDHHSILIRSQAAWSRLNEEESS